MPLPAIHLPMVQAIVKMETAEKWGVAAVSGAMYGVFNHIRALVHPWHRLMCHCEGAKRRGNLAVPSRITGRLSAKS